ncbi:uncharacterized protein LOC111018146 [Momordica charantia]|uniref:Uncharacterized protein LOC111018146 n=1 Tax=Momordica charantia TaxID=3673 RepID=A0A6J1D6R6_MOMCH|nr:uncharacterized protein LOC111018146 [Momordica charantia]
MRDAGYVIVTHVQAERLRVKMAGAREDASKVEERVALLRTELVCTQRREATVESYVSGIEKDLEMAKAEAFVCDARIAELESRLLDAEDRLFKAEEGDPLAESDLVKSKEAEGTTLDSLGRESASATSLKIALEKLRSEHATTLATTESSLIHFQEGLRSARASRVPFSWFCCLSLTREGNSAGGG